MLATEEIDDRCLDWTLSTGPDTVPSSSDTMSAIDRCVPPCEEEEMRPVRNNVLGGTDDAKGVRGERGATADALGENDAERLSEARLEAAGWPPI